MKRIVIAVALLACFHALEAQDGRLYWKYKDYDGAVSIRAPRFLVHMGSWFIEEKADRRLLRHVHRVKLLAFEGDSPVTDRDRDKFYAKARQKGLEEILTVRDGNTHVRVLARERRAAIRKLVFFVQEQEEFAMISVCGRFKLDELGKMISKYTKEGKSPEKEPAAGIQVKKI